MYFRTMTKASFSIPVYMCVCVHARRANSVAWNPHKLLLAGLQCSALLLQDTTVCIPIWRLPIFSYTLEIIRVITE